ncbi:restriction endonuclease subunit S [Proteiniclasticum sp. SCR006]|uniref:Restriction endonuclease subunit S n=1 Tax=Proteiniclasticum aestuarii TaxID=2817862 RepID=A0A939KJP7_9CLOT|nr:restriction endonuclease subunit S [Proteiniclasticum aestuarii]MBO1265261.1 restriction endonuclease subunit S [Proteiniclasticum aestuarii]
MDKKWIYIPELLYFQEGPGVRKHQYTTEGVKLLNVANLVDGKVDLSTSERYISDEEAYGKYSHFLADEGDLIIASSGIKVDYFDKKMGFVKKEHLPLCMNTSTIRFKSLDDKKLNINYFMYFLKSNSFKHQLYKEITGSAQLNFGPTHLSKMKFPLIDIDKQFYIADVLSKIERVLEHKRQQLNEYDYLIKSRFVEMFGDVDSNWNSFPIVTLNEVCRKITDGKHGGCGREDDSGYYFIGAREIFDGEMHYDTAPQIPYSDFEKDYKRCNIENGDLVIVNTGATIGKTAIANSELTKKTLLQKSVALIKTNSEVILPKFLQYYYICNTRLYKVESASAQPNLLISKIKETKVILPPLQLQDEFILFTEQVDKLKLEIQKSLDGNKILYDSLMQEYFG